MARTKDSSKQVKLPLSKETVSDSDLESESEENLRTESGSNGTSESDEQSENGSVDESESEQDQSAERRKQAEVVEAEERLRSQDFNRTHNPSTTDYTSPGSRPAGQFTPPPGFIRIRDMRDHLSNSQYFSDTSLQGKEVWHFSVPAGLSLEELHSASLVGIQRGEPVFERQGVQYGLASLVNADLDGAQIMIPSKGGYKTISAKINKTIRIQRVAAVPNSLPPPNLPPRPRPTQPAGLRMRYKPSGFGEGDPGALGDSDTDDFNKLTFRVSPQILGVPDSLSPKKRKTEGEKAEKSHKKSKSENKKEKHKHKDKHKEKDKHQRKDKEKKKRHIEH